MEIYNILIIIAFVLFMIIICLAFAYWYITYKKKNDIVNNKKSTKIKSEAQQTNSYTKVPIFNFMQFDKIQDNMIVQDNGNKYLMVLACEGVNYDLMSEVEKTGVESGFLQFLNTLRFPIQLYVQTRTINIESSIIGYKQRLNETKEKLEKKRNEYNRINKEPDMYPQKNKEEVTIEMARLQNLYDYGADVIKNIEKTSQNKNVLKKHYYVVIPYYVDDMSMENLNEEEKLNRVFSELYMRAQSLTRALFVCSVKSKVMTSTDLAELLYVAYNRDESDVYKLDTMLNTNYDVLYTTAPDVIDKRIKALDEQLQRDALKLANEKIQEVKSEKEKLLEKKEKSFDEILIEIAKDLLKKNKLRIGKDVAEKAIEKIDEESKTKPKKKFKCKSNLKNKNQNIKFLKNIL